MNHDKKNTVLATLAVVASLIACAAVAWALTQNQTKQTDPSAPSLHQETSREASLAYWNALIELDKEQYVEVDRLLQNLQSANTPEQQTQNLVQLAEACSTLVEYGEKKIARLPMLGVDDALLRFVREELLLAREINGQLTGMARAAIALDQWKLRQASIPEDGWAVFFDGFVEGFLGKSLGVYEESKANAARLDAEARQLVQVYSAHQNSFVAGLKKAEQAKIEELELRSRLTSRFGVEFPARPEPSVPVQQ